MKSKHIAALVILVLILLIVIRLVHNKKVLNQQNQPATNSEVKIPVNVAEVKVQALDAGIQKQGTVAPFKESKILATNSGQLSDVHFELGQHVQKGQVLAAIDTRMLQLQLQKSGSNQAKLKRDLQTYTDLLNGNAATREKVDEIRQNYNDEINQGEQIRKQISDAGVRAPISGVIATKSAEQGVFVNPGAEIGSVLDLSKAKIQVYLTETEVYQVRNGAHVKISADVYPDKIFDGIITFISPQADDTHNYLVEITLNNGERNLLRSGTFVHTDFGQKSIKTMLVIPREALTASVKDATVYVVENATVHLRSIVAGIEYNGLIEVRSGLKAGDRVVVSGQINLKDGAVITISN
jgi:membrane fusion protein (multidrug efflux system)